MGVNHLWEILDDGREQTDEVTCSSLAGQTVAVDLSGWIVELKKIPASQRMKSLYLRNLFYRTIALMKKGIKLVFVMDGEATSLKASAIKQRKAGLSGAQEIDLNRSGLVKCNKECSDILKSLGLPCLQSPDEAESLCAYLNKEKLVDGCFTEDGDFFCFGGKVAYRKLEKKGKTYTFKKYNSEEILRDKELGQGDFIALALILGCDFGNDEERKGIPGVGKEKSMKLIHEIKSNQADVLDRLQGWKNNEELQRMEAALKTPEKKRHHCKKCCHSGTLETHFKGGCLNCKTQAECIEDSAMTCECPWHRQQTLKTRNKYELDVFTKAMKMKTVFPNTKIIDEYLKSHHEVSPADLKQSDINMDQLGNCLKSYLHWDMAKVIEEMVPIIVQQQLHSKVEEQGLLFKPVKIVRACREDHVPCYETEWVKTERNTWASRGPVSVKLEKDAFQERYPKHVADFQENRRKRNPDTQTRMTDLATKKKKSKTQ